MRTIFDSANVKVSKKFKIQEIILDHDYDNETLTARKPSILGLPNDSYNSDMDAWTMKNEALQSFKKLLLEKHNQTSTQI